MNEATGVAYEETEDPAYYQYDCDQIQDASHGVLSFGEHPNLVKIMPAIFPQRSP